MKSNLLFNALASFDERPRTKYFPEGIYTNETLEITDICVSDGVNISDDGRSLTPKIEVTKINKDTLINLHIMIAELGVESPRTAYVCYYLGDKETARFDELKEVFAKDTVKKLARFLWKTNNEDYRFSNNNGRILKSWLADFKAALNSGKWQLCVNYDDEANQHRNSIQSYGYVPKDESETKEVLEVVEDDPEMPI